MSGGPRTAAEVARQINLDERGTSVLLKALEAIGYVSERNGRYANTLMADRWTVRRSPRCIADAFKYFNGVLERWGYLDQAIRDGKPPMLAWEWFDRHPAGWQDYNEMMITTARMADDEILAKVKLPSTARRLIDVGGGHGQHAIAFCRRYPGLSATVLDWPQAREVAEKTIAAEKMGDRVTFRAGDFWADDLGVGYDVALLFNIIHMYLSEKNSELLHKVARALNPGGLLVILDQMAVKTSGGAAQAMAGLIGLDLFVEVCGQTYRPPAVVGWLKSLGLPRARWAGVRQSPGFAVVWGQKAG